jgi:hypothetical protein
MYTRQQYIKGECNHRAYYGQFVNKTVTMMVERRFTTERLLRCSDQEYFNTIPLHNWDQLVPAVNAATSRTLLKAAEEGWSLSTGICIAKEAARQIVEAQLAAA